MFWIVTFALAFGLFLWWLVQNARSNEERAQARAAAQAESDKRKIAFALAKAQFWADNFQGVTVNDCKLEGRHAFLGVGDNALRLVAIANPYVWNVETDRTIKLGDLRSVEFVQEDVTETFLRKEITPVAVSKNKSAIGRGAVGAVLLGPAGLVLGAASAMTSNTKVVEHTTTVADQRTVKGPPTLVLTTRDREHPFVRLEFAKADEAKALALYLADEMEGARPR